MDLKKSQAGCGSSISSKSKELLASPKGLSSSVIARQHQTSQIAGENTSATPNSSNYVDKLLQVTRKRRKFEDIKVGQSTQPLTTGTHKKNCGVEDLDDDLARSFEQFERFGWIEQQKDSGFPEHINQSFGVAENRP